MGEQLSLNLVLHRDQAYRILDAEMNWHCHCSDVAREGGRVRIRPSGRVPAIVHLSDLKTPAVVAGYRANRLFYETTVDAPPATSTVAANGPEKRETRTPPRICVYTCLMGESERLNEQPAAASSRLPFICFTDNPDLHSETWEVRVVPRLFAADPIRSQRAVKILPYEYLSDFDASLYIDNSVLLAQAPDALIEKKSASAFCLIEHSFRATVLDEFLEVANRGLDDRSRIFEQLSHYTLHRAEVLQEKPYWGAILLRNHRDPTVRKMLEIWFAHVQRYSRRDQLSVNLAFRLAGLTPDVLRLDNHKSEYHSWPHKTFDRHDVGAHRASNDALPSAAGLLKGEQSGRKDKAELSTPLAGFTQALAAQQQQYDALLASEAEVLQSNANQKKQLEAAMADTAQFRRDLADARQRNEALLASNSWRVTAPLRALARLLRGLKRPAS